MPLRQRISVVAAAAVAVAVALAVIVSYVAVRHQVLGQIDTELRAQATAIQNGDVRALESSLPGLSPEAGGPAPYSQIVLQNGSLPNNVIPLTQGVTLPDVQTARVVASGTGPATMTDVEVKGAPMRMYTFQDILSTPYEGQSAVAIQLARPLSGADHVLSRLRLILALLFLACVALAAGLGRIAARRVLMPLAEVTATAQAIGETDDLSRRLAVYSDDEVGQLAGSFNEMLERLESSRAELDASVTAQRQLVADASHELRTPVTSLRTNIEVLLAGGVLDDEDRERLLADVVEQSEELSTLVSDLIEVARGDMPAQNVEDTRLDRLVEAALDRARRNAPDVEFTADLTPVAVNGNAERLNRAINNLLDNASRHTEPGTPVDVTVDEHGVTVRDHGAGISEQDLPHVFDRFYRGENSRARQGSGLGLAIVRQVAEQHGGTITAGNAADGGAVFTLSLPGSVVLDDSCVPGDAELST